MESEKLWLGTKAGIVVRIASLQACAVLGIGSAQGADRVWNPANTGTTIETAADYFDTANWVGGTAAEGSSDVAYFTNGITGTRFVKIPRALTVKNIFGSKNGAAPSSTTSMIKLTDSHVALVSDYPISFYPPSSSYAVHALRIYADLKFPNGGGFITASQLCGDLDYGSKETVVDQGGIIQRLDLYANAAGEDRTGFISTYSTISPAWASYDIYAPHGSSTNIVGKWSQTKDSPYLRRVGDDHVISAGTLVHGTGITEGTFVKRVFSDDSIELSNAVTEDCAENEVTFDRFAAKVHQSVSSYDLRVATTGAKDSVIRLMKYRPEDDLRLEVWNFAASQGQHAVRFGTVSGYQPGTFVLHNAGGPKVDFYLANCHLELGLRTDAQTAGFTSGRVMMENAADIARLTVTGGLDAVIADLSNVKGTLVKDGTGCLTATLSSEASGAIKVEEGTLALKRAESFETDVISVGALEMSDGTTLSLEGCTVRADKMTLASGFTLSGDGVLIIPRDSMSLADRIQCVNGASIGFSGLDDAVIGNTVTGKVAGHPAFWLDASKESSVVYAPDESGVNLVTRWNDCRAGEPMFCTNIVHSPQYVNGDSMSEKYVRIGNRPDCGISIDNTECLVWNRTLTNIKEVFLVQDPSEGGGVILGRSSRLADNVYSSFAGAFYRDEGATIPSTPFTKQGSDVGWKGRFFLDGVAIDGTKCGYMGSGMQLVDFIPYLGGSERLQADAFGLSFRTGSSGCSWQIQNENGHMRIAEYIIYTNELTHTERVQTAQYLMEKWTGRNVPFVDTEADNALGVIRGSANLSVANGDTLAVTEVSATAAVRKSGAGTLYLRSANGGSLTVDEGKAVVRSFSFSGDADLPCNVRPWLHLDADDLSSMTFSEENGKTTVTQWRSQAGDGHYVCKASSVLKYGPWTTKDPFLRESALNGRMMVDTGDLTTTNPRMLAIADRDGKIADGGTTWNDNNGSKAPKSNTAFVFYGSEKGGNSILGSCGNSYPSYGLPGLATVDFSTPMIGLTNPGLQYGWTDTKTKYNAGTVMFHRNGEDFNPFTSSHSGNFDLITYSGKHAESKRTATLAGQEGNAGGGMLLGEVVLYSSYLGEEVIGAMESYLMNKWLDSGIPGYSTAHCSSLSVAENAMLEVCGLGGISVDDLSGAGEVKGAVTLTDAAMISVVIGDDGSVPTLTVDGALALPEHVTVNLSNVSRKLAAGRYLIVGCEAVSETPVEWTVVLDGKPSRFFYSVSVGPDGVALTVGNPGLLLIVR